MPTTIRIDHVTRIEGHAGLTVELLDHRVGTVQFDVSEGARLLERLVKGRRYDDVAPIVSRICAICSVAHALTALKATEHAFDVHIAPSTETLRDLLVRGQNIESHALHLFLLALPDYLGYPSAPAMAHEHRDVVTRGLRLKRLGNVIQEMIGGRAIHPVNVVLGGFATYPTTDQLVDLRDELRRGLDDCQAVMPVIASLPDVEPCPGITTFAALQGSDEEGYYSADTIVLERDGTRTRFPAVAYHALTNETTVRHSHAKHSSFDGGPFMVGALARLSLNADQLSRLAVDAMHRIGLTLPTRNCIDNNKAQFVELMCDTEHALHTVERLLEVEPEWPGSPTIVPRESTGTAVTEAPRGLLCYSLSFDDAGMVTGADVVTPTAINAACIEEQVRWVAGHRRSRDTTELTRRCEMILRAFDPCISCSVHVVQ